MKVRTALLAAALLFGSRSASAALTTSEKGQVKDFVSRGKVENAGRVRSLVARTDLSAEESVSAMSDALSPIAFDDARAVFLRELLFGAASAPSRPLLANVVTRGLVARANVIYGKYVGGLDHEPRALAELSSIYAFLDAEIANAGKPTAAAHDAAAGIPSSTYEACSQALAEHVEQNARWLKGDGVIPESVGRLRAQAHALLLDMLPDGLTRRVDAGDKLGLGAARKKILADYGVLVEDAGKLDEPRAERLRQILAKLPGARVDMEVLFVSDDKGAVRARGLVVRISGAVSNEASPFGDEVTRPADHDARTSSIAHELAVLAAKRALDSRAELRLQAERDAIATKSDAALLLGRPRAPSVEHVIGAAIHLIALDPGRAMDLAFARLVAGRPEAAALLSDAIGALAAFGTPDPTGPQLDFAKAIRLAPNGVAIAFTAGGHAWTIDRAPPTFAVSGVKRDGHPVELAHLTSTKPRD